MINNGKAKIENTFGTLSISIPSKKNWVALIFSTAWLGGWYFGFQSASSVVFSGNNGISGFIAFWLIAWTVGGIMIISVLLWGYFGKEEFVADRREVYLNKTVFGVGIKKRMEANEIKNIRTDFVANANWFSNSRWTLGGLGHDRWAFWGLGPGKIKFDYGFKTFSFGLGVDEAEANYIVELMKGHLKL
jgi:hypothetical protein